MLFEEDSPVIIGGRYADAEMRDSRTLRVLSHITNIPGASHIDLERVGDDTFAIGLEGAPGHIPLMRVLPPSPENPSWSGKLAANLVPSFECSIVRRMKFLEETTPDVSLLASGNSTGILLIWNTDECVQVHEFVPESCKDISGVTDLPRHGWVVAGHLAGVGVRIWDLEKQKEVARLELESSNGVWDLDRFAGSSSFDDFLIVPSLGKIKVYDPRTIGSSASSVPAFEYEVPKWCKAVCCHRGERHGVFVASHDGAMLSVFDLKIGRVAEFPIHPGNVNGFWSRIRQVDSNHFVSATQHGEARITRFDLDGNTLHRQPGVKRPTGMQNVHSGVVFMGIRTWMEGWDRHSDQEVEERLQFLLSEIPFSVEITGENRIAVVRAWASVLLPGPF